MTVTWVVGAGGLLGRSVAAEARRRGDIVLTREIPWHDPQASRTALRAGIAALAEHARQAAATGRPGASGEPAADWAIAWCAGAGVVATPQPHLDAEVSTFTRFLSDATSLPPGRLFLASSAGGVYAGSPDGPPYTERSTPVPLAPYGHAKLAMEREVTEFARRSGSRVLVGRISNLYGPGQNLGKAQGLISLMCKAQLTGQPLSVFVPMDTVRDYLYVDDCAAMAVAGLARLATSDDRIVTKILASGRGASIAVLVGEATRVFRRRPPLVFKGAAAPAAQVRDLRFTSLVWLELDNLARTPLPVGMAATGRSIARALAYPSFGSGSDSV